MTLSSQIAQARSELHDAYADLDTARGELEQERNAHESSLKKITKMQEFEARKCHNLVGCMFYVSVCDVCVRVCTCIHVCTNVHE